MKEPAQEGTKVSPASRRVPILPADKLGRVDGYGMRLWADGYILRPKTDADILESFQLAKATQRQIVLRGAGRSYGDASIAPEQIVLDICEMNQILAWDPTTGIIEVEAGATIEDLWRKSLPDGWWPPVVSGTMAPTIAGALGMNIHGKNAFKEGTIGEHILWIDVIYPDGSSSRLTPENPDFPLVVSGAGLLGVIVRAAIQMHQVPSGDVDVLAISCPNWEAQFAAFEANEAKSDYMVSWIDCFAAGSKAGRGLFHSATYAASPPDSLLASHQDLPSKILGIYPKSKVWKILKLLNTRGRMKMLNAAKHLSGKLMGNGKTHRQSLVAFSFLLDYVPNWRHAYLPGGFIQYQSFIPREKAPEVFRRQLEMAHEARLEPFLGVLKRHRPDRLPFIFGHALDGYSLALDFKVTEATWPALESLCHRMNELVLEARGRFYLAKDSTLRPTDFSEALGAQALSQFSQAKARLDREDILTSSLAKRFGLD